MLRKATVLIDHVKVADLEESSQKLDMLRTATVHVDYLIAEEAKPTIEDGYISFYLQDTNGDNDGYSEDFLSQELAKALDFVGLCVRDEIIHPDPKYETLGDQDRRPSLFDLVQDTIKSTKMFVIPRSAIKESYNLDEIKAFRRVRMSMPVDLVIKH